METSVIRSEKDNSISNNVCHGCNLPIIDRCLSKVLDRLWHDQCIRCSQCHTVLKDKCFTRDSNLYCKQDFYRLFGVQCSGCDQGIFPSDLVRRVGAKIFHMSCLKCYQCGKEVSTGDQLYILEDGSFMCKSDYEKQENVDKTSPQLKLDQESDGEEEGQPTPFINGNNPGSDEEDDRNRRRGPRTTIKAKQLEVLKAAFLATPKPSRHIREKLAQDTGLTMRVIQVWFQNRRSKERRVKQLSVHDAGRGFRKNVTNKDTVAMNYPYFQNPGFPQPMDDHYNQPGFTFDIFNPRSNPETSNVSNNDTNMPLSLPIDNSLIGMQQRDSYKQLV